MRIISGEARGRTLFAPQGTDTRPTSDKIRGSLFNILGGRVLDARILDLFGGTGALALEALSRGASRAVIVDHSRQAMRAIERNARNVLKDGFDQRVRLICSDYRSAIDRLEGRFDLVFLDPPYRLTAAYGDAVDSLRRKDLLDDDCLIVMERLWSAEIELPGGLEKHDTRRYGETVLEFVGLAPSI